MEWNEWIGKNVYIETRSNRRYTGKVVNVELNENPTLIWITIISSQGNRITFVHSEITLIQEDRK
jgi:small nuclear ribonucleoprotein (snRNP)-like protein